MNEIFIDFLREEFELRRRRNSTYSLRAYSRDLGVGLGSLSEALNGKRELSKKNFEKALEKIHLTDAQKEKLLEIKKQKRKTIESPKELLELIDENTFKLISDWYYLAILNLAKLKSNSAKPEWVSKRLGLDLQVTKEAMCRLKSLGLLKIKSNKLIRTAKPMTTSKDIPSMAIKNHHLGNLKLAEKALFEESVDRREFGSITMPVNPDKLERAKEILMKTRIRIGELLDSGETSEIYTLSFQLFPLTQKNDSHSPTD